jgi:hypothetical protein
MHIDSKKLYFLLTGALFTGYAWLFYSIFGNNRPAGTAMYVCFVKHLTSFPCPSCGSTRSLIAIIHGHLLKAICINPVGIILAGIMIFSPFWLSFDIITRRETLFKFYCRTEDYLKRPKTAALLIFLILINWIWNITKGY